MPNCSVVDTNMQGTHQHEICFWLSCTQWSGYHCLEVLPVLYSHTSIVLGMLCNLYTIAMGMHSRTMYLSRISMESSTPRKGTHMLSRI